ncbi:MAG: hypothetical protein M3P53_12245 [Actinomycetota bacterium]|nr:hypothetical protein [Actinomycetota bacterium]
MSQPDDGSDALALPPPRHRRHRQPGRKERVKLHLSDEEYAVLAKAAEASGLTPSGFAAEAALAVAKGRELPDHGPLRLALVAYMRSEGQLRRAGVNLNQAVAELNATGAAPVWLGRVVQRVEEAVAHNEASAQELSAILLRGRR